MTKEELKTCPHADVQFCPLYLASHLGEGLGCDDGELGMGRCAVSRGMDYASELGKISVRLPRDIAELKFREEALELMKQRRRNMKLAGIH